MRCGVRDSAGYHLVGRAPRPRGLGTTAERRRMLSSARRACCVSVVWSVSQRSRRRRASLRPANPRQPQIPIPRGRVGRGHEARARAEERGSRCAERVARGAIGEGTARHRVPHRASGGEERLGRKRGAGGAIYRMLLLFRQLRIFCVVCTLRVHSADFVDAGHIC